MDLHIYPEKTHYIQTTTQFVLHKLYSRQEAQLPLTKQGVPVSCLCLIIIRLKVIWLFWV